MLFCNDEPEKAVRLSGLALILLSSLETECFKRLILAVRLTSLTFHTQSVHRVTAG